MQNECNRSYYPRITVGGEISYRVGVGIILRPKYAPPQFVVCGVGQGYLLVYGPCTILANPAK
jgi:hypothetical protein